MNRRIIKDITDFIFVSDIPEKSDVIFIPGSSKWEITELAAQLYNDGFANLVFPAGKYSSSLGYFPNENITNDKYKGNFVTDAEYVPVKPSPVHKKKALRRNQSAEGILFILAIPRHNRHIGGQQPEKIFLNIQTVCTGSDSK